MTVDAAVDLVRQAAFLGLLLAAPALAVSLAVGLCMGILQTVTQIQESSLSSIPRLVLVLAVTLLILPWSLERLMDYSTALYRDVPSAF